MDFMATTKSHRRLCHGTKDGKMDRLARSLDKLAIVEDLMMDLPAELQKDVMKGMKPQEMRKKWSTMLTAKAIAIGLTAKDEGKALSAIKDLADREEGRAVERKDVTHHLEKLSDKELDAILKTDLSDAETAKREH